MCNQCSFHSGELVLEYSGLALWHYVSIIFKESNNLLEFTNYIETKLKIFVRISPIGVLQQMQERTLAYLAATIYLLFSRIGNGI
jgi:hypothetical protein